MPHTFSWPAISPSYSMTKGTPAPSRYCCSRRRTPSRMSNDTGPVGARRLPRPQPGAVGQQLVLQHPRVALAHEPDRHRAMPTGSRQIHVTPSNGRRQSVRRELLEPGTQLGTEIVAIGGELHDGLDVVHPIAGVVATTAENDAVHAGTVGVGRELLQRVGELDLAALAGLGALEDVEHLRGQHVAADHREVRRGVLGLRLLDEAGDLDDPVGRRSPRPRRRRTCRCGRGRPP